MKKIFLFLACFCCISLVSQAQEQLLPQPQQITEGKGKLRAKTFQLVGQVSNAEKNSMKQTILLPWDEKGEKIELRLVESLPEVKNNIDEAYSLTVEKGGVVIEAVTSTGLYRGLQTLSQLHAEYDNKSLPCLTITDWPSFKVRGLMQDVGRSYVSMEELKREIEALSRYKINVFHWHLTENQAWRLESKRRPELVAAKNMTRMAGKYYTIEEAKELQAFCKAHHVQLIPEIDMPGHSAAFVRAFGVDMQSEEGMVILKDLIDEACEIFHDVEYIHIGTDEVRFTNMEFCDEMVDFIRARGKKVMSWNPGWNYKKGEIDMTQMWSYRGKPTKDVPAIDSRLHYLNHFDNFADLVGLYTSRIADVDQGSDQYAGSIMAIWHDRYIDDEYDMMVQNNLYPSMLAFAERTWQGGGWQYFDDFGTNLIPNTPPFDAFVNFEERMLWHKERFFEGYPFFYFKQTDVCWNITDPFANKGDLTASFEPEEVLKSEYMDNGKKVDVNKAYGSGIYLRHVWGDMIPTFLKKPEPNNTVYAWTYVYSPKKQEVGLMFETQNYSRSEKDLAPPKGKWDYRESKIWVNEAEIAPPAWTATHTELSSEIPLGNENLTVRDPERVQLNKGWNKVLIKLPIGKFSFPKTRLVKWMFTAVFVSPDGKEPVKGLIYSPEMKK